MYNVAATCVFISPRSSAGENYADVMEQVLNAEGGQVYLLFKRVVTGLICFRFVGVFSLACALFFVWALWVDVSHCRHVSRNSRCSAKNTAWQEPGETVQTTRSYVCPVDCVHSCIFRQGHSSKAQNKNTVATGLANLVRNSSVLMEGEFRHVKPANRILGQRRAE